MIDSRGALLRNDGHHPRISNELQATQTLRRSPLHSRDRGNDARARHTAAHVRAPTQCRVSYIHFRGSERPVFFVSKSRCRISACQRRSPSRIPGTSCGLRRQTFSGQAERGNIRASTPRYRPVLVSCDQKPPTCRSAINRSNSLREISRRRPIATSLNCRLATSDLYIDTDIPR